MAHSPLKVLIVEDSRADAKLILHELREAGFDPESTRVENEADYVAQLEMAPDVILCDYNLPQFNALQALQLCRKRELSIPFIIVSGSIGEEVAVMAMKQGASDYLLKDRMGRLGPAVANALKEHHLREAERQTVRALRDSEERFRIAFENTAVAMVLTTIDNRLIRVNAALAQMFGYSPPEMLGLTMAEVTHPDDLAESYAQREVLLSGERHFFQVEKRYLHQAGHTFWGLTNVSLVRDPDGRPLMYVGQIQDITQRKQAEEGLRLFRTLIDRTTDAIEVIDPESGRFLDVNERACLALGYTREEYLKLSVADVAPLIASRPWEEVIAEHQGAESRTIESQHRRKDGSTFPIEINLNFIRLDRDYLVAVVRDVTERKQLEDQYRQAQKMEAIGRLAGGVAHDFNNLLTVINGYGEMLLASLPAGDPNRDQIREIVHAGERAAALTRQLLAFSRKAVIEPRILDLKTVVTDVERMLRRVVGEDIQLTVTADPEVGAVKADPGQVEQVILNLVVNARDAMPRGGRLTIELQNAALDSTYASTHPEARPGQFVLLAVADTGCGMDAATIARIFEPFFTTKGEHGTGLGLATVHGIVRQAGGHVAVYSEVGHGTTFKVYLPRVEKQAPLPKSHSGQFKLPHGGETVLLVEDEDGVRTLVRQILQSCGYTVLVARDGVEGLRIAGLHQGPLDLLLTDVIMPRMSGREVAERLVKMHPGTKVLFLSGYTDDAVVRHGILEADVAFLQKPFSTAALTRKVREVLDQPAELSADASRDEVPEVAESGRSASETIRILLVDDHSILRAGIRKLLHKLPRIEVVAEASDGREALALVADHPVDIVFMDIAMSGLNGLEATMRMTKEFPTVRVIMLSMHADEEHVWKALRAGAAGYLLKHADLAEIELALETVIRGESYITPAVSKHIVAEFIKRGGNEASSVELLTSRQREVLQLLAEGKTTKEIARLLLISAKTVETHRAQVMERLDIHDLPGLVRYAIRVGLIHPDA